MASSVSHKMTTCKDVSKEMNELEDFFHSLAKAHVMAAAMHYFGMEKKTSKPTQHQWSH